MRTPSTTTKRATLTRARSPGKSPAPKRLATAKNPADYLKMELEVRQLPNRAGNANALPFLAEVIPANPNRRFRISALSFVLTKPFLLGATYELTIAVGSVATSYQSTTLTSGASDQDVVVFAVGNQRSMSNFVHPTSGLTISNVSAPLSDYMDYGESVTVSVSNMTGDNADLVTNLVLCIQWMPVS